MIDPLLTLSFNIHAQHGTYALLIGSGVSRSASIPTGWEVTLDLVAKLAHLQDDDCKGDEAGWYETKFGKEPNYSEVLSSVASTPAAQQHLLKSYFEPTDEEREEGKKLPTAAHQAIAKLVSAGHIKVIVTTNFDRLLETALEAEGIAPVVIASSDAAKGAPPLTHSKCTVIKVHGDYLDHRIKNSPEALAKYEKSMDRLLDQVFDEYGLIVCGWSGEYDVALRRALERTKTRRYPMYWTGRSDPRNAAKDLIAKHNAHFVKIDGADSFFASLLDKVHALDEFDRPHPISTQAAVVTLKKYLSEDKYRIQLRDFLVDETEKATSAIEAAFSRVEGVAPDQQSAQELMNRLESACEILIHLFANGSFYAKSEHARAFFDVFHMIVASARAPSGYKVWIDIRRYPALLLVYAAGMAAIASDNYAVLREIASRPSFVKHDDEKSVPAPVRIHTHSTMQRDIARQLIPNMDRRQTPVSDYLLNVLREPMRHLIPDDTQYERIFDEFEYLWCLLHVDGEKQRGSERIWAPYGAFCWRRREYLGEWLKNEADKAIAENDESWQPVKAGLFGGAVQRLSDASKEAQPILDTVSERFMWGM